LVNLGGDPVPDSQQQHQQQLRAVACRRAASSAPAQQRESQDRGIVGSISKAAALGIVTPSSAHIVKLQQISGVYFVLLQQ
jgi:hypothetical protein